MTDMDSIILLALLIVILAVLFAPPGPGTPLRSPAAG